MRRIAADHDVRAGNERVLQVARDDDARGVVHIERIGDVSQLEGQIPIQHPATALALQQPDAFLVVLVVREHHAIGVGGRRDRVRIERRFEPVDREAHRRIGRVLQLDDDDVTHVLPL